MPKPYTFPTLYNEAFQLSITKLKEWEYLNPKQLRRGTITWSRNGIQTGCISIKVDTQSERPNIELNYKYNDEPRKYKVGLVSIPSNLGKGLIWYFICPETNKRCRKLYLISGYFLHREAFSGCMYESQTQTKKWRDIEKIYGSYFDIDKYYMELNSKHFKKFYNGKPTKRYLKILGMIKRHESISNIDIERLLINGL